MGSSNNNNCLGLANILANNNFTIADNYTILSNGKYKVQVTMYLALEPGQAVSVINPGRYTITFPSTYDANFPTIEDVNGTIVAVQELGNSAAYIYFNRTGEGGDNIFGVLNNKLL